MRSFFRYVLILVFLGLFAYRVNSQNDTIPSDSLISFSKQYLGTRYCYSNCTPKKGFDCSGFVYFVFSSFGHKVPRSSIEYKGIKPAIPMDSARVGDIIVFTGTNAKNRNPGHVGIVISRRGEELKFIHSSSGKKHGGVVISSFTESPYYLKRYLKVVRIVPVKQ